MRIALLSDLHANRQALESCLAHALHQGVDQWAFLGDLVGYGGEPRAVLDLVMELAQSRGAWVLLGNHDQMALTPPARVQHLGEQGAAWTHAQLLPQHRVFLEALPLTLLPRSGLRLVHASADDPAQWRYVDSGRMAERSMAAAGDGVRWVFGGHVHEQGVYFPGRDGHWQRFRPTDGTGVSLTGRRPWVVTVGSVGQPRDGDPRAMYAVFDLERQQLRCHRVPYDHQLAAQRIREAGMPDFFAERLAFGR